MTGYKPEKVKAMSPFLPNMWNLGALSYCSKWLEDILTIHRFLRIYFGNLMVIYWACATLSWANKVSCRVFIGSTRFCYWIFTKMLNQVQHSLQLSSPTMVRDVLYVALVNICIMCLWCGVGSWTLCLWEKVGCSRDVMDKLVPGDVGKEVNPMTNHFFLGA